MGGISYMGGERQGRVGRSMSLMHARRFLRPGASDLRLCVYQSKTNCADTYTLQSPRYVPAIALYSLHEHHSPSGLHILLPTLTYLRPTQYPRIPILTLIHNIHSPLILQFPIRRPKPRSRCADFKPCTQYQHSSFPAESARRTYD